MARLLYMEANFYNIQTIYKLFRLDNFAKISRKDQTKFTPKIKLKSILWGFPKRNGAALVGTEPI